MQPTFAQRLEALERVCFVSPGCHRREIDSGGEAIVLKCMKVVTAHAGLPLASMRWLGRTQPLASWRLLAMYLAVELSGLSTSRIAALFNRQDHATILHARRVAPKKFPAHLVRKLRKQVLNEL